MLRLSLLSLLCLIAATVQACANDDSAVAQGENVEARLIAGAASKTGQEFGLMVHLAEGWHAYWRMPGDAGLPPRIDWTASSNVADLTINWPAPHRSDLMGLQTFGYTGEILFPLDVTPKNPSESGTLAMTLSLMICKDICVPQDLKLSLPLGPAGSDQDLARITEARKTVPAKEDLPGLKLDTATAGKDGLTITATSEAGFEGADLFAEADGLALTAAPTITVDKEDPHRATLTLPAPDKKTDLAAQLKGKSLRLTLTTSGGAVEKDFPF